MDRIASDRAELEALEIWIFQLGLSYEAGRNVVELELAARSAEYAREVLRQRYGDAIVVEWVGVEAWPEVLEPWDSCDVVGEQDLVLRYTTFKDNEHSRVAIEETPSQITLTAYEREWLGGVKLVGIARAIPVHLNAPLGDRTVIDGAADPPSRLL